MEYNYNKYLLYKVMGIFFMLVSYGTTQAQDSLQSKIKSYSYFKSPLIEDNSFLIEEAFNQEAGVVQFISTCYFTKVNQGDLAYSLTHEIPLKGVKHQFSYTLNYFIMPSQPSGMHGLGDLLINYRYELSGKNDWALLAPRISLILPTGDVNKSFGLGAWGGQVNVPISKLLSNKVVTHYNAGFTYMHQAKFNLQEDNGLTILSRHDLTFINAGASIIWMPSEKLNLMLEYVSNYNDDFEPTGRVSKQHQMVLNPGLRYAFNAGRSQIVPGVSVPVALQKGQADTGMFFYLSIEPNFNLNSK